MRVRFFLVIAFVILCVTTSVMVFYDHILEKEFASGIRRQLRSTAVALLASDISNIKETDFRGAEDLISTEIGKTKVGKFFILRDASGRVIYKDKNVELFDFDEMPYDEAWGSYDKDDHRIFVLNLKLGSPSDRILQVGAMVPESAMQKHHPASLLVSMFLIIMTTGLLASWVLTSFLMRPLKNLGGFLASASTGASRRTYLPSVPVHIYKHATQSDEFYKLVEDLNSLIKTINANYNVHRLWTSQMAHELKTPLALMSLRLENLVIDKTYTVEDKKRIDADLQRISGTINSFLDWAEIEFSENKRDVFACKLQKTISSIVEALPPDDQSRIKNEVESDPTLFCHPRHLEQLIINLLSNALKYSDPSSPIFIRLSGRDLCVVNNGPGFSEAVLSRLGEPFNKGSSATKAAHGLGLAWIASICKIYEWEFSVVRRDQAGQTVCSVQLNYSP